MSMAALCIFIINFLGATSTAFEIDYHFENLEQFKVAEEPTLFDSKIWTEFSKLLAIEDSDSFCEGRKDFIFPDFHSRSLYYRCQNGKKELYQCIENFEFDTYRLRCTPKNISEYNTSRTNDCFQQVDNFYPDFTSNCEDYFKCQNEFKTEKASCPSDQAFSFHLQNCQPKKSVTCVKLNCHKENDDFYSYPGSKCQAYYYCKNGIRLDFICPKGSIFNRQSKTCVESGICFEPVCAGRVDGKYADTTQDCTRTFHCKGGVLEAVNSCPPGQIYNGLSCSLPQFGSCDKPEKTAAAYYFRTDDECKALQDGTHIVPGTDCRNVRTCSRGKTTAAFVCPKDHRFNGYQCFPKDVVSCDDFCSMKIDGYYADELTDCQDYYLCLNGKVMRRKKCPNHTAFNGYMCVPNHLVSCPKKSRLPARCLGLRDGFHPDYFNMCRNYFYCHNHEMILMRSCLNGMVWDERQCFSKEYSECEGLKEIKECNGLPPGLYQNKTSGCTKYFYCNSGSGTILSCPPGLLFNGNKCVNADEYTCLSSSDCINQTDGYRQETNTGCRSYYYCSSGNKITYICPDALIFNGSHCVSSQKYKCPYTPSTDCIEKEDGYHPDILSGCKKYYYCYRGEKLNTLTCGGKKIFNGQGCVLVEDPKLVCLRNEKNLCADKNDGTYMDPRSECRRFFSCKNKITDAENWCPQGYGFNGSICVKSNLCSCKSKEPVCDGNRVRFFQDFESDCKNYYVCIGQMKTIASCPRGTVFNGQLCIDSNYYKCPNGKS